jgi:hypothetical protein
MDFLNALLGDAYTRELLTAIALLIVAAILWLVWKFFFAFFKHVLTALFIAAIASGVYYYVMNQPPPRDANLGKHAYGVGSNRYLGEITGATEDAWVVKSPGGYEAKYPKARVLVKDKMDPITPSSPSPTATPRNQRPTQQRPR